MNSRWVWDGRDWVPQYVPAPAPRYIGLTVGAHVMWAILTLCTCGVAGIFWAIKAVSARRRIY